MRFGWPTAKDRFEQNMKDELRDHIERQIAANVAAGMTPDEARRQAKLQLGAIEGVKEDCREERRGFWLEMLWTDIRYGFRLLLKSPGFTCVAILTLALGIGANAAIFGFVDSTLLSSLPFHEADRLVYIWTTDSGGDLHTPSPAQYAALKSRTNTFEQVAGMGWVNNFYGTDESGWQNLPGLVVSSNWLPTLEIQPLLGRNFFDEEETPGRDGVALLSYRCWRIRFHADRRIIGKQIVLNRRPTTIVGVLPQSLEPYYQGTEIFTPLVLQSYENAGTLRDGFVRVQIVARLKPGMALDPARSETASIGESLRRSAGLSGRSGHLVVERFLADWGEPGPTMLNQRHGLLMTALAAGLALLIACANVASLLLARAVRRSKEFTVRSALGASRARIISQLLTESTLLFLCGGILGLVAAWWSEDIITRVVSGMVPNGVALDVNARVFVIGLGVSLLTALAFGIVPALHAARARLNDSLKDTTARAAGSSRSRRARNVLVVFQIALGMVLLVGFGLLFRSLLHVESSQLGFDPRNVLTASVTLPSQYADPSARARLMRDALERVRLIPGVESAGIADSLPMEGGDSDRFKIDRPSLRDTPVEEEIWFLSVSPEYFSALEIPMLQGRAFIQGDNQEAGQVAVINEKFASVYFPHENPVGYHVAFADSPARPIEIVGVVSDFRQRNPEEDLKPLLYFPVAQTLPRERWSLAIRVRAARDGGLVGAEISNWLRPLDPQLYWEVGTMDRLIHDSESLTLRRPIIAVLGSIGGLAIILVIVGVFGVTSYSVAERTREIGIRVALGAARRDVIGLVLFESFRVALTGLFVGAVAALGLAHFFPVEGIGWSGSGIFLYQVSRTDSLTYIVDALLLTSVVIAAAWIPAIRALRVDPIVALRHE